MTDKALVERLRINIPYEAPRCLEAADRIEALNAEVARLREALEFIQPAALVLQGMCQRIGCRLGADKAAEMEVVVRSALTTAPKWKPPIHDDDCEAMRYPRADCTCVPRQALSENEQ